MKNVRIFVVLLCLVLTISCEKDSKVVTPFYPVASFETLKEIYEDGETIHFYNTSQHADSQLWKFGDLEISAEDNPVFTYKIRFRCPGMFGNLYLLTETIWFPLNLLTSPKAPGHEFALHGG